MGLFDKQKPKKKTQEVTEEELITLLEEDEKIVESLSIDEEKKEVVLSVETKASEKKEKVLDNCLTLRYNKLNKTYELIEIEFDVEANFARIKGIVDSSVSYGRLFQKFKQMSAKIFYKIEGKK